MTAPTRVAPWRRAGTTFETTDPAEALRLARLDFDVSARDLAYAPEGAHDGTTWTEAPHRKLIVREPYAGEPEMPFDVVSATYRVTQYRELLNLPGLTYVAGGRINHGRQGYLVGTFPGALELPLLEGRDPHELYVVARASHDRTRPIEISMLPLRLQCTNQLPLLSLTQGARQRWSFPHRGDVENRLAQMKASLDGTLRYATALQELADRLNKVRLEDEAAATIVAKILPATPTRDLKTQKIVRMWHEDPTVGFPGTGWGLVNAVSSFYDWERVGGSAESRFTAVLNGFGDTYKAVNRTVSLVLSRHA